MTAIEEPTVATVAADAVIFTACEACGGQLYCQPGSKHEWRREWAHTRGRGQTCRTNRVLRALREAQEEAAGFDPVAEARLQLESAWSGVADVSAIFSQRSEQWSRLHNVLGSLAAAQSCIKMAAERGR